MSTIRKEFVTVAGLRVHLLAAGETGPAVVLVHGGGLDSASLSYGHVLGALGERFRVFAPDLPGFGESELPDAPYDTQYFAGFLRQFLSAVGLEHASLVGLSLGGGAALTLALREPGCFDRLVLVGSYGLGKEVPFSYLGYLLVRLPLVNEMMWAILKRSRRLLAYSLNSILPNQRPVDDCLLAEVQALLDKPGAGRAWRAFQRQEVGPTGLRTDYSGRLGELTVPTLILHGSKDSLVPVEWARRAQLRIPNAQLQVLPGVGHWLPRDDPEGFKRALLEFLPRP
ncbi:MAG: alpha/beta fold hydrolase [Anaerolineae bacterium]